MAILTKDKFYIIDPAAATNLITNPSFETGATGWTASGAGVSIARSATYQRRGAYSLEVTTATGVASGAYFGTVAMTSGVTYYFSVDVRGTSGQAMRIYIATTGGTARATTTFTANGYWQRVNVSWACNSSTSYRLYVVRDAVASTDKVYIDGAQCETAQLTTYLDGDMTGFERGQTAYRWNGTKHASTSYRTARTRSGGVLVDISTYCSVLGHVGLGMPSLETYNAAINADGSVYQGSRFVDREFALNLIFTGSPGEIYANRKALIDLVKPDRVPGKQELVIRYQGQTDAGLDASEPVDIVCVYAGGLEMEATSPRSERAVARFVKHSPTLELAADAGAALGYATSVSNFACVGYRDTDGQWKAMGTGANASVFAIVKAPDGSIYIGGTFTSVGGVANTAHIAKWDGSAWSSVGGGLSDTVYALAVGADGSIYAGGLFLNAGGVAAADYIAKWNGSAWTALGSGTGGTVYAILASRSGNVYAGGSFTNLTDANGDFISKWNGSAWSSLGTGISGGSMLPSVQCLAEDTSGNIYAGGDFTLAGGVSVHNIAKWDGSAWSTLGIGLYGGATDIVRCLAFMTDSSLVAGGDFPKPGLSNYMNIARWNGASWESLVDQINSDVYSITRLSDGSLWIGGSFDKINNVSMPYGAAVYKNGAWTPNDINVNDTSGIILSSVETSAGIIYIGGGWAGSTATSATVTAQTVGGAAVYPCLTFTGPGTCWQIKNYTNGNVICLNSLTLQAGETAVLDTNPMRFSFTSSWRGNLAGYILPGSTGFRLEPGANNVSAYMTGTTAASAIVMTWRPTLTGIEDAAR